MVLGYSTKNKDIPLMNKLLTNLDYFLAIGKVYNCLLHSECSQYAEIWYLNISPYHIS